MFSYSDCAADDVVLSCAPVSELRQAGPAAQRLERQAAARKILTAYRMWVAYRDDAVAQPTDGQRRVHSAAEKMATGDVSVQFGVSKKMAGRWVELGLMLQTLPALRRAFLAGDHSVHQVTLMARAVNRVDDDDRGHAEHRALELANEADTDPGLSERLDEMVIEFNPEKAATDVEDYARDQQQVVITHQGHGHVTVEATIPAEDGEYLRGRVNALIGRRLCRRDPRTLGQRRVAALCEVIGRPGAARLTCCCGHDDCARRAVADDDESVAAGGPALELTVIVDPSITVPYLRGYGPIDHARAQELAAQATRVRLARSAVAGRAAARNTAADAAVAGSPPLDPTGHGGHQEPPPGALTYTPSKSLRDIVLETYRFCVYPNCGRRSEDCDIDHVVPFNRADPRHGGWTVDGNLMPLCQADHQRKHLGPWVPVMNADRSITWRHTETGDEVIVHPHAGHR